MQDSASISCESHRGLTSQPSHTSSGRKWLPVADDKKMCEVQRDGVT